MPRMGDIAAQDAYDVPLDQGTDVGWANRIGDVLQPFANVATGLGRDIPRAASWFGEQARKSPEAAQADVRGAMGGLAEQLYTLPERTLGASEMMRTEGTYNPAPAVETALTVMGGGVAGTGERAGAALGSGPIRKASALPMDEASRLARATEQGYTIDAFKGGQPYDWNTLPEYTGLGKVKPGTEGRIPKELTSINSPNADYAGFFSNNPDVANRFAAPFEYGAVWPTKLKFENPVVIDAQGRHAADFQFPSLARERGTTAEMDKFRGAFKADSPHDGVILKNTKDEGDVYVPRNPDQVRSRFAAFDPENKGSGFLLGSGATDKKTAGAIQGIRAYHSSPHDFDKFDLAKIGSGEGAQVYGHGLYFAENPAVSGQGGQYWNQFSKRFTGDERTASTYLQAGQFDRERAAENLHRSIYDTKQAITNGKHSNGQAMSPEYITDQIEYMNQQRRALKLLESGKPVGPRTYEVNINADPAHMLDWDKALTGQSEPTRDALRKVLKQMPETHSGNMLWQLDNPKSQTSGAGAYDFLASGNNQRASHAASQALREAGIPGIKYLDQGSRNVTPIIERMHRELAGYRERGNKSAVAALEQQIADAQKAQLSSNYVIFDPSKIDIMKKYGIAGATGAGGMGALAA